ncbi:hypothetical protein C0J52_09475 [Blattella germanica]|nr:hypothetical protein C0J52_09475 [Blattella germanica]
MARHGRRICGTLNPYLMFSEARIKCYELKEEALEFISQHDSSWYTTFRTVGSLKDKSPPGPRRTVSTSENRERVRLSAIRSHKRSARSRAAALVNNFKLTRAPFRWRCSHQVLTADEIIASVIDDQDLCDEEEEPSDEDCAEKGPSSEEAFHCLETAMKWVEQQEECDAVQLLCFKRSLIWLSHTVTQWTKAVCFGSRLWDTNWLKSPWWKKFSPGFRPVYETDVYPSLAEVWPLPSEIAGQQQAGPINQSGNMIFKTFNSCSFGFVLNKRSYSMSGLLPLESSSRPGDPVGASGRVLTITSGTSHLFDGLTTHSGISTRPQGRFFLFNSTFPITKIAPRYIAIVNFETHGLVPWNKEIFYWIIKIDILRCCSKVQEEHVFQESGGDNLVTSGVDMRCFSVWGGAFTPLLRSPAPLVHWRMGNRQLMGCSRASPAHIDQLNCAQWNNSSVARHDSGVINASVE